MALIKNENELAKIRMAGRIQRSVMASLAEVVKIGAVPKEIDKLAEKLIRSAGAEPAFKNYQPGGAKNPYPATICASVNNVIVHDAPTNQPLKEGDIFKIDIGVRYQGYNTDSAQTFILGRPKDKRAYELVGVTRQSLELAIEAAQTGNTLGDIGHAIQSHVEAHGFHVVKGLSGHGIGQKVHEDPHVFNFGTPGEGMHLEPGMVIAIEPMVAVSTPDLVQTETEAYASKDGSLTAHFEHTIIITSEKAEIVT
ncbi:MAG: type I methionyl aminopeptidase [Candidatus Harrisonbacteria bacterium CG10_big_fil_rev_8_21_14_0_10_45_28]|uniref:Methionine aminopeptidase n=1 Tax=Candidatus Harrisonbacteria bacterium CG10_big_fil_rev_8_21_14_0_10_45_28 TaxID=1974586 RepID=A0A2H0UNZ7_9BACT|nr:MAG: type I methionyl aminopeptidase [Candidatus Harrisonbacteria bacterium CG10_big_fil_rev_8_21_14_0_10_45_28]